MDKKKTELQPEGLTLFNIPAIDQSERRYLAKILKPDMVFYDVGACSGLYTCVALHHGCHVVAFEPVRENMDQVLQNIHHNNLELRKCVGFQQAVSNQVGFAEFNVGGKYNHGSLGKAFMQSGKKIEVPTITLDRVMDLCGVPAPDVVKIDANGAEPLVLEGGKKLLHRYKPIVICKFDAHHEGLPTSSENFCLISGSYTWYRITNNGELEARPPFELWKKGSRSHINLVALPN